MVVLFVGAATGLAELDRDVPHAILLCLVPSETYISYWLACLSFRPLI